MTGTSSQAVRWTVLVSLVLLMMATLAGTGSAAPGDLTGNIELDDDRLEANVTESEGTVSIHGNVTFDQPIWQYASASFVVDIDKNWTVTTPSQVSNRGPGGQSFNAVVTVPTSARGGEVANLQITAQFSTRFGTSSSASVAAVITVRPWVGYRLNVTGGDVELVVPQGGSGKLVVPLRNVGNVPETFTFSVPYWYGLRPLGLVVESPGPATVDAKATEDIEFTVQAAADAVPREYVFKLEFDAASLPTGGTVDAEIDPRPLTARVHVTGDSPPEDPYKDWGPANPPPELSQWHSIFGASAQRSTPDVDPSGRYLVYSQYNGGESSIYLADVVGGTSNPLTYGHKDYNPVISPNGQMIAFTRSPDRIIIVNHNGSELMEFGSEFGLVDLTDWSPTGDRLLFSADYNIYDLDLRTNTTRRLAGDPVFQWNAVYSNDGGRIFYLSYESAGRHCEVWSMSADGSGHRQLTFNDLVESSVSVSPNGNRVAFTLIREDNSGYRVCVMNVDGSDVRYFTGATHFVYGLRWDPEGDALIAEVRLGGNNTSDVEMIAYPWKDAGAKAGGGDGAGGGGGSGIGWWDDLTGGYGNYVILVIVIVIVLAIGGNQLRDQQRRRKEEAAEELRRRMEVLERARTGHAGPGTSQDVLALHDARTYPNPYQAGAWDGGPDHRR